MIAAERVNNVTLPLFEGPLFMWESYDSRIDNKDEKRIS